MVSGLSLIELLVVIAIISALAAVLSPAYAGAKRKAQLTACKSNLHELGVGLRMYLDDSAGVYPYVMTLNAAYSRGLSCWFDALNTEIPNGRWGDGVFKCVAYQGIAYEGGTAVNSQGALTAVYAPCGSYAYNASGRGDWLAGSSGLSRGLGFSMIADQPDGPPVREAVVKAPADLYVFGDAPLATGAWGTGGTISVSGAADYNSFAGEDVVVEKATHFSVFNMLLADTHVEGVSPSVLLGTNAVYLQRWNYDNLP
jgi:prepilin-type N-terminal cleavage/methylation domain-containing protein